MRCAFVKPNGQTRNSRSRSYTRNSRYLFDRRSLISIEVVNVMETVCISGLILRVLHNKP
jgi:hypothetical protein